MTPGPAILSALATATTGTNVPVPGSAPVLAPGGSPFDSLLMLEELAASMVPLGAPAIDAGAVELGSDLLESAEDLDGEDSIEEAVDEDEDLLAFLAGMITAAPLTPPRPQAAGADPAGEGDDTAVAGEAAKPAHPARIADVTPPVVALETTDDGRAPTPATNPNTNTGTAPGVRIDADAAARAFAAFVAAPDARPADETGTPTRASDFLAHAPRTSLAQAPAADQAAVARHVRDPRWAEEFGARIVTMVNQRESIASISLMPADLGPVDVNVTVKDTQATIHFGASQADTRALIEASLPKLRELLAAQGFQLMDASVSQGFTRQSRQDAPSVPRPSGVDEVTPVKAAAVRTVGLLDTYA